MPYKNKQDQNEWRRNHPEVSKRWKEKHSEQHVQCQRDSSARCKYGIPSHEEMLNIRNTLCMICGKKAKKMCIDHEGPPTKFNRTYRGVLCQQCNTRLGWFEKFGNVISDYLKRESVCLLNQRPNAG